MSKFCRIRKFTVTIALVGLSGSGGAALATEEHGHEVVIKGGKFSPAQETVHVGDTLVWHHEDGAKPHSVTADDGSFDSSPSCRAGAASGCLKEGDTFKHTFTEPGRFTYYSRGTEGATGAVVVEAEG